MGLENRSMVVSEISKREIIHGGDFEIFHYLFLFPVFSGFEPGTVRSKGQRANHSSIESEA